jgi:hypothetical protein
MQSPTGRSVQLIIYSMNLSLIQSWGNLNVSDEHGHEDEAECGERYGEERLPGVDGCLEPLAERTDG